MNLPPVPETDDIEILRAWCVRLHEFLQYPVFHGLRLYPRSTGARDEKGGMIYDTDDDLFKGYTGSWDEFGDIT